MKRKPLHILHYALALLVLITLSTAVYAQEVREEPPPETPELTEEATPGEEAAAEVPMTADDAAPESESIFAVIYKGGLTMLGLAIVSTIIVAFGLERYFYFRRAKLEVKGFYEDLTEALQQGGIPAAHTMLNERDTLIANVLRESLVENHGERGEKAARQLQGDIQTASNLAIGRLERGLGLLANLGNLAPLLGFFGTVVGMRVSFLQFVEKAAPTAQDLAGGVEEALITTAAGLLVAIPTYLVYQLFLYRIDEFTLELERSAGALVRAVARQRNPEGVRTEGVAA